MKIARRAGYGRWYVAYKMAKSILLNQILITRQYIYPVKLVDSTETGTVEDFSHAVKVSEDLLRR